MPTWLLLILFFSSLLAGIPVYLVLGGLAFMGWLSDGTPLISFAQRFANDLNSYTLISLPLFVIAAVFMDRGGITRALINFASALVGARRGSLAVVCVVASAFFAAICGSSVASAMAMGAALIPEMRDRNYPTSFSVGTVGAAGTLGILIPPSLPLIIYGIVMETSVPQLFLAGVAPGILQAAMFVAFVIWFARRRQLPVEASVSGAELRRSALAALPALLVPVVVLGGIYSGLFTVSEAAGVAAFTAIFVSVFVYRHISITAIPGLLAEAVRQTAVIVAIILSALAFGHWMTSAGVTDALMQIVRSAGLTGWEFLLIANLAMFVLGMFLEVVSVILIFVPLVAPIVHDLGIDPVQFGLIVVINMELALLTPPVGLNVFVLQSISGEKMTTVIRGVFPYVLLLAGLLALVTFVPEITLWLPKLIYRQ